MPTPDDPGGLQTLEYVSRMYSLLKIWEDVIAIYVNILYVNNLSLIGMNNLLGYNYSPSQTDYRRICQWIALLGSYS
jgi:hypothetical protein